MADQRARAAGRRGARTGRARLTSSADFDRVYRQGRSHANRYLVIYAFPRAENSTEPRLGVSVGRRVGGAVERNRMKRLMREAFAAAAPELPPAHDYVLVARPDARVLAHDGGARGVEDALRELIQSAGLGAGEEPR